jgi:hypothetical protein
MEAVHLYRNLSCCKIRLGATLPKITSENPSGFPAIICSYLIAFIIKLPPIANFTKKMQCDRKVLARFESPSHFVR